MSKRKPKPQSQSPRLKSTEPRKRLSISPLDAPPLSTLDYISAEDDACLRLLADFQSGKAVNPPGEPVVLPPIRAHGTIQSVQVAIDDTPEKNPPESLKDTETQQLFTRVYQKNAWGSSESVSGTGSNMKETQVIREAIPELVKKYAWKKFVDIPCGDLNWMKTVDLGVEHYVGGDIVPDIIKNNIEKYGNDQRAFQLLNITESPLPAGDVLLCRDCLVHFSYEHIEKFLCQLHKSGIRYLLSTTFTARNSNSDIVTGNWRPVNLEKEPFNFPRPLEVIVEKCSENNGKYFDKSLALWEVQSLPKHLNITLNAPKEQSVDEKKLQKFPPKISIVLPVYNVEEYLRKCLDSIVNQTLREIQVICVNDGSTDGSLAILREYAARDSRVEIIDKPNGGVSSARNAAYPSIRSEYTMFADPDDWFDLNACRVVYERMEQSKADILLFEFTYMDENLKPQRISSQVPKTLANPITSINEKRMLLGTLIPVLWNKSYRTDFLRQNNITCPPGLLVEDVYFNWLAVLHSKRIVSIPDRLYYYRNGRPDSDLNRKKKKTKRLLDNIEIMRLIRRELEKLKVFHEYQSQYHNWKLNGFFFNYSLIRNHFPECELQDIIRNALDADDLAYLSKGCTLPLHQKKFYDVIVSSVALTPPQTQVTVAPVLSDDDAPKISIIIPVYNVKEYLAKCLDSVVNQTLRDIQIICVNDGSTDGSRNILQEYADRDSRIEIIDKSNGGGAEARNAAFPSLKGKYTMFVDSDDYLNLDACRKVYEHLEQSKADILIFEAVFVDKMFKPKTVTSQMPRTLSNLIENTHEKRLLMNTISPTIWTKSYRTDFLQRHNITFPTGLVGHDNPFVWQTTVRAGRIAYIPDKLYYYYSERPNSLVNAKSKQRLLDFIEIFRFIRRDLEALELFHEYRMQYNMMKMKNIIFNYSLIRNHFPEHELHEVIRNSIDNEDIAFVANTNIFAPQWKAFFNSVMTLPQTQGTVAPVSSADAAAPKISIIIPVYNVEEYLPRCLDSVVKQTFRDIQIICVNDGSTDGSRNVLQKYADRDSRIEIIDKPNAGAAEARNAAFPSVKGKYTMFVDSDDWLDLDACRKVHGHLEQSRADVLVFEAVCLDKNLKVPRYSCQMAKNFSKPTVTIQEKRLLMDNIYATIWTKAYRTAFLRRHNITFPPGLVGHDNPFVWQTIVRAERIAYIPDKLCYHLSERPGSIVNTKSKRRLSDFIEIYRLIRQDLETLGLFHEYRNQYHLLKMRNIIFNYSLVQGHFPERELYEAVRKNLDDDDIAYLSGNNGYPAHLTKFLLSIVASVPRTQNIVAPALTVNTEKPNQNNVQRVIQSMSTKCQPEPIPMIPWTGKTCTPLGLIPQSSDEWLRRYKLKKYHIEAIRTLTQYIDFRNKTILEVGGCNLPRELIFNVLGVKKWICVERLDWRGTDRMELLSEKVSHPLNHPDSKKIICDNDYVVFDGSATEIGEELYDTFDACISICAFEHIDELHKAVDCIHRSLKPQGILCSTFAPIWSCSIGHHFWVDGHRHNFNNSLACHVPPFAHLLYSAAEIDELLAPYYTTEEEILIKNKIVERCTDDTSSNRLFYEDFLEIMKNSRFENISVMPRYSSNVSTADWDRLCRRYPNYRSFCVNGIVIVAKKYNEIKNKEEILQDTTRPHRINVGTELPRKVEKFHYKSYSDLSQDIRSTLPKIPSDIDLVVGIPKSGMIPAMMIGLSLNIPTSDLDGFLEGRLFSHGSHRCHAGQKNQLSDCKKILVIDDTVLLGKSLKDAQKRIAESSVLSKDLQILYMAVYCTPSNRNMVDFHCQVLPTPRIFEWNWTHHAWYLKQSCVDIDGVLCPDPTESQNDDGKEYIRFIEETPPLYLPKHPIHTLVTNRLEKYRASTEKWLAKHGVVYHRLVMLDLPTKQARIASRANYGENKAKVYSESDCVLFIESSHHQALGIVKLSGKPVLSIEKQVILNPGDAPDIVQDTPKIPTITESAIQNALNDAVFVEKLWGKNNLLDGASTRQIQRERSEFIRASKPEELKRLQNKLVANTDELSCEIVNRYLARSRFCLELEQTNVPIALHKAAWNTFSKVLCSIYPKDAETQDRIKNLGDAYHCPYQLPSSVSVQWHDHLATSFGLNQFPPEIQKRVIGKDIIDGGGCAGESAMIFTEYGPKKVYAFEPNPDTVPEMKKILEKNAAVLGDRKNRIEVVPMALGKSKGTMALFSRGAFDGAATTLPRDYKTKAHKVDVISIDEFVEKHGLDVGLIKLDVEGAEYDTILGAKKTILKQKPLLIIAIYHSVRDFFEIKPLIESWDVGYKFTIRHHLPSAPDTDFELLAYCEEITQETSTPKEGTLNVQNDLNCLKQFDQSEHNYRQSVVIREDGRVHIPDIRFFLALGCNLKCEFCGHAFLKGIISKESLIDSFEKWNKKIFPGKVRLYGGEPFLNPDIAEIVIATNHYWPQSKYEIVTNGVLLPNLSDGTLQIFGKYNVHITISRHLDTQEFRDFLKQSTERLRKFGIRHIRVEESRRKWTKLYDVDANGVPQPCHSDFTKSYRNCTAKHCTLVHGDRLYRCPVLLWTLLATQSGAFVPEWNEYVLKHQPVTFENSPLEIRDYLHRGAMPECAMCSESRELIEARQLSMADVQRIKHHVGQHLHSLSDKVTDPAPKEVGQPKAKFLDSFVQSWNERTRSTPLLSEQSPMRTRKS